MNNFRSVFEPPQKPKIGQIVATRSGQKFRVSKNPGNRMVACETLDGKPVGLLPLRDVSVVAEIAAEPGLSPQPKPEVRPTQDELDKEFDS